MSTLTSAAVTEEQIVSGCRRGERAAQRALYDLTSERVYRLLLRMLSNAEDASDVAQETYLRVFDHIAQFTGQSRLTTWVHRIAVNEGLQFLRRRGARERAVEHTREQMGAAGEATGPDQDVRLDVTAAVSRLPEAERVLIILRYFQGMDYEEMAGVLDKPAGTIASGLNRAREILRRLLGESADSAKGESPGRI